jgi:hypothetical protein
LLRRDRAAIRGPLPAMTAKSKITIYSSMTQDEP